MARKEDPIHIAILGYLRAVLPPSHKVVHVPNNPRSKIAGARLKRLGMLAGAPDLMILRPAARCAWIEVKPEGEYLSQGQKDFRDWCKAQGHPWAVCRSIDDARDFLEAEQFPTMETNHV